MHFFVLVREVAIAKFLLDAGINIQARNSYGWTALIKGSGYIYPLTF